MFKSNRKRWSDLIVNNNFDEDTGYLIFSKIK